MNTTLLFINNDDHTITMWFEISTALFNQGLCDKILDKEYSFSEYHSINDDEMIFHGKNEIEELNVFLNDGVIEPFNPTKTK